MIVKQIGYFKESDVNELREKGTEFNFYKTHKNTVIIVLGSPPNMSKHTLFYPKNDRLPWKVTNGNKIVSAKIVDNVDISEWNNKEQIMVYERI